MTKYKIQLSMFGLVAERADVVIYAKNKDEARDKAIFQAENGDIEFSEDWECVDGWDYQVEECKKI